jgi:hypothetical protein
MLYKNLGSSRYDLFVFLLFFIAFFSFYPIFSVLLSLILATLIFPKLRVFNVLIITLLVVVFSLKNNLKIMQSDYIWYFSHYSYWVDGMFWVPFDYSFNGVYAKETEFLYHAMIFTLAKLGGGDRFLFDFFITIMVYVPAMVGVGRILRRQGVAEERILIVMIAGILLCINPTIVTQLIRQNIAASIVLLGFSYFWCGRYLIALLLFSCAVLIHNSSMFLALMLCGGVVIYNMGGGWRYGYLLSAAVLGYILPQFLFSEGYNIYDKYDGSISYFVYGYDFLLIALSCVFMYFFRSDYRWNALVFAVIGFYIFSNMNYSSPLLQLRFYLYYDFARFLLIAYLLTMMVWVDRRVLFVLCLFSGFMFVELRYFVSDFDFYVGIIFR